MSTIVINVDDKSSIKLFIDLARKLHYKARVLTADEKEDFALCSIMDERLTEPSLPVESALDILSPIK